MERKIGEIFEYNGEWYQCVEDTTEDNCNNCCFQKSCNYIVGNCSSINRSDGKTVAFKKLEKVGEPFSCNYYGDARLVMMQEYQLFGVNVIYSYSMPLMYFTNYKHNRIAIEIKQTNEDMEEKNNGNTPLNELTDKYVNGSINYDEFEKEVKALYSCKEEIKPTLKPFDLEAAKSGKPVCTRDGRNARIICFDAKGGRPIVALVTECDDEEEVPYKYHCDGSYNCQSIPSDNDLMILTERKEGWVNVYKMENEYICENECNVSTGIAVYKSEGEAKRIIDKNRIYVNAIKITWEE